MRTFGGMPTAVQSKIIELYDHNPDGDDNIIDFAMRWGYDHMVGGWVNQIPVADTYYSISYEGILTIL
jgi:hypothetical protein